MPLTERRKKPRARSASIGDGKWVVLMDIPGHAGGLRAKLVNHSEGGIGVETSVALESNQVLLIQGLDGLPGVAVKERARVAWCKPCPGGYSVGLEYQRVRASDKLVEAAPDYYEMMQISPSADVEVIHRVYRLLAQRYHPDNANSGDGAIFCAITEAYKTLCDPEKRAAYDVLLHSQRQIRWRIFDQAQAAGGKQAERVKRRGILDLLYAARQNQPHQPTMTLLEMEDLLGCPREHLEFSLWYLKENALVARADNGRFSVTAKGVDYAELHEEAPAARSGRLLIAGAQASAR